MKLKFLSKSLEYIGAEPIAVQVILGNDEGAYYPIKFPKDYLDKTEAELYLLALEKIYQDNFPNRAENEKFNEINEQVAMSASSRTAFLRIVMTLYGKGLLEDEDLLQTGLFDDEAVE